MARAFSNAYSGTTLEELLTAVATLREADYAFVGACVWDSETETVNVLTIRADARIVDNMRMEDKSKDGCFCSHVYRAVRRSRNPLSIGDGALHIVGISPEKRCSTMPAAPACTCCWARPARSSAWTCRQRCRTARGRRLSLRVFGRNKDSPGYMEALPVDEEACVPSFL